MTTSWVWDSWSAHDARRRRHHLFFLHAPIALGGPELRHRHARIGHASSADLVDWAAHPGPLPEPVTGFDDLADWTGCAVHDGSGWWLFNTCAAWPEEAWRDPWVVGDGEGTWQVYVTARDAAGEAGCGVVGHATSTDLRAWVVGPALSVPTGRFEWLEVISVVRVEGRWALVFSCLADQMPGASPGSGGVWSVPVEGPGAPVDVAAAVRVCDEHRYAAHVVERGGASYLLGFRHQDDEGRFVGGLAPSAPVRWRADGAGLEVVPGAESIEHGPVQPGGQHLV